MLRRTTLFTAVVFLLLISACTNNNTDKPKETRAVNHQTMGVCVWDRISTRSEPRRKSASTTLLSLGESFLYLDSSAIDSAYNNTKFLKARLSDSSVVWVYGFASVLNAQPAVITGDVPLYLRPDLLTITSDQLKAMEIVAVVEEWDDWIKVTNEKKEKTGWIKKDFLSYTTIDIAFGLLVRRSLEEEDAEQRIQKLEDLLDNNPYPNTVFITDLRNRLDEERELLREKMRENENFWDWENNDRDKRNR